MKLAAHCQTIPASAPFMKTLAVWVLQRYAREAADMHSVRILLPNRRACRALRDIFLDITDGMPMLLPRIQPIGDFDEDGLPADILPGIALAKLPPPILPERRLFLLTRLVMRFEQKRFGAGTAQAVQLARQLARFLDDIAREGLDIHALPSLVDDADLAQHWQESVRFLNLISEHWPQTLKDEGAIDPVDYRNRVLDLVAETWRKTPPSYPVIAAGSTGTQLATANLLSAVARLPQGMVILPGLDRDMPDAEWDALPPTHPQHALRTLLASITIARRDVTILLPETVSSLPHVECLRAVFQPPEATARWAQSTVPLQQGLRHMQLLEAETQLDEARLIAAALRETLETPEKTAALVTPDRVLARMVAAQMKRFGVDIDDSAGNRLADTPPAAFLRLILDMAASQASPVSLLAVLRHPLAAAGRGAAECRRLSRILESELLRGIRFAPGLQALCDEAQAKGHTELAEMLRDMDRQANSFMALLNGAKPVAPAELLSAHLALAEWLAPPDILWAGDAGRQLAACLAGHIEHAGLLPPIPPASYAGFFETLLAEEIYRPRYGLHPRLHILSPMEARLQHYDLAVLGGLNEGSWPALPDPDPWMSRPMRTQFGLPPLERAVGQSAHDFFSLCAASPQVLLTRARKIDGTPAIPSRWLVRLETLLKGRDRELFAALGDHTHFERMRAAMDKPDDSMPPLSQPKPVPPREARLSQIRVTAVDDWLRDPYMIYARYILGLDALEPLDAEPGARDFGKVAHEALKAFSDRWPDTLPDDAEENLLACGREAFARYRNHPSVAYLWQPRFEAAVPWIIGQERQRRPHCAALIAERKGRWPLAVNGATFTLTTTIDRLELDKHGNAAIVDYKTGTVPKQSQVKNGEANQLPLEALVAMHGVLDPALPHAVNVTRLEYWRLARECGITAVEDVPVLLEQCKARLEELIATFNDPQQPFAANGNPALDSRYNNYAHLTRRQEWGEG